MPSRTTATALAVGLLLLAGCQQPESVPAETEAPAEPAEPADDSAEDQPMDGHYCQ